MRRGHARWSRFLDAPDADTRYVALLTAGSLPYAELVPGVLRGLFDAEPDVSSAARAAATALRRLPRFQAALPDLRQELVAKEPERRVLAARALGMLHDRASVEGLIGLTASDDALSAQAAAEALIEITRASFGTSTHGWMAWWAENKVAPARPVAARGAPEPRAVAPRPRPEELAAALGDTLGYSPDAPESERAEGDRPLGDRRCSTRACARSTAEAEAGVSEPADQARSRSTRTDRHRRQHGGSAVADAAAGWSDEVSS